MKCRASFVKKLSGSLHPHPLDAKLTAQHPKLGHPRIGRSPIPTNPKTSSQTAQRNRYMPCVDQWNALTPEEQKGWETDELPGYQAFMKDCLKPPAGCVDQLCAVNKPDGPYTDEPIFDYWWWAQTFKSRNAGIPADCDILRISWWLSAHLYEGWVHSAIRAVDALGHPTGANLSTGKYWQPFVEPDLPFEEKQITMSAYKLLANTQYALLIWIDGGGEEEKMWFRTRNNGPPYADGSKMFSWDYGVTWSGPEDWWDCYFEVYGCVY